MWTVFEWIPRTLIGFLAPVGGAHGVDLAGFALGQVKVCLLYTSDAADE